jgi:hypothetical protein
MILTNKNIYISIFSPTACFFIISDPKGRDFSSLHLKKVTHGVFFEKKILEKKFI